MTLTIVIIMCIVACLAFLVGIWYGDWIRRNYPDPLDSLSDEAYNELLADYRGMNRREMATPNEDLPKDYEE